MLTSIFYFLFGNMQFVLKEHNFNRTYGLRQCMYACKYIYIKIKYLYIKQGYIIIFNILDRDYKCVLICINSVFHRLKRGYFQNILNEIKFEIARILDYKN